MCCGLNRCMAATIDYWDRGLLVQLLQLVHFYGELGDASLQYSCVNAFNNSFNST